jgi:hypothetical protein
MGLPSIVGSIARDQERIAESDLFFDVLGPFAAVSVEDLANRVRGLLLDRERRTARSIAAGRLVDGRGCERVFDVMTEMSRSVTTVHAANA